MRGRREERIEAALDRGAAAVLAAAVAFSLVVRLAGTVLTAQLLKEGLEPRPPAPTGNGVGASGPAAAFIVPEVPPSKR